MELYKDEDALARHNRTDYYNELIRKAGPLMAALPDTETLDAIV
jgi:quinol monooxygenase YgiN